jgi:hypothetical protein
MVVRALGPAEATGDLPLPGENGALRALVTRDVKGGATETEKALLRRPETLKRWHDTLVGLNREVQAQFTERRAAADLEQHEYLRRGPEGKGEWFAYRAQYNAWRAGANRFRSRVEESLSGCKKRLMRECQSGRAVSRTASERTLCRQLLHKLRDLSSNEAAITPAHQGARRKLSERADEVLFDQVRPLSLERSGE